MLDREKSYCICISGQMRLYEDVFAGIKRLFDGYDVTYIVSVWDLRGGKMFGALNPHQCQRMFPPEVSRVIPPNFLYDKFYQKMPSIKAAISERLERRGTITEGMIRDYFPHAIVDIETDAAVTQRLEKLSTSEAANSYRMLYKIARANDIKRRLEKDRGKAFDIVIRTRPDRPLEILRMPEDLVPGTDIIYLDWFQDTGHSAGDQVAISTSDNLDRYAGLFEVYDRRLEEAGRTNYWSGTHRELAGHLKALGLRPKQITPHLPVPMEEYFTADEFANILRIDEEAAKFPLKAELSHFRASIQAAQLLKAGQLDEALAKAKEAIAATPNSPGGWYVLAQLYRKEGRGTEALDAANHALRLAWTVRGEYFFINELASYALRAVDAQAGLVVAEQHVATAPQIPVFHAQMGFLLSSQGVDDLALRSFRKALEIDPNYQFAQDQARALEQKLNLSG